jgi:hypothetical protein
LAPELPEGAFVGTNCSSRKRSEQTDREGRARRYRELKPKAKAPKA